MNRKRSRLLNLSVVLLVALMAWPQEPPPAEKPVESERRKGPGGLEGWTLLSSIPNDATQQYAFTLVLARSGHVVRRISGDPLVWNWMFRADGKQVAYESGPLHFGMSCILADIESGRQLATFDCYHKLPDNAPDWVVKLEAMQLSR
ncbi:MAG: hypothetical protein WBE76_23830 [Terracidiphilus sp.]